MVYFGHKQRDKFFPRGEIAHFTIFDHDDFSRLEYPDEHIALFQMGMQKYDISDENTWFVEVFVSSMILFVILLLADIYLRLSWAMTLSICIFYSTSIVFITTWIVNYFDLQIPDILK